MEQELVLAAKQLKIDSQSLLVSDGVKNRSFKATYIALLNFSKKIHKNDFNFLESYLFFNHQGQRIVGATEFLLLVNAINDQEDPGNFLVEISLDEIEGFSLPCLEYMGGDLDSIDNSFFNLNIEQSFIDSSDKSGNFLFQLYGSPYVDSKIGQGKDHDLLTSFLDFIYSKVWVEADCFPDGFRSSILFVVFIHLSLVVDLSPNNKNALYLWMIRKNIYWFDKDYDSLSAETKELHHSLIAYALKLSSFLISIFLGHCELHVFKYMPNGLLAILIDTSNEDDEDSYVFSSELTNKKTSFIPKTQMSLSIKTGSLDAGLTGYNVLAVDTIVKDLKPSVKPITDLNNDQSSNVSNTDSLVKQQENIRYINALNASIKNNFDDSPVISRNVAWEVIQDRWHYCLNVFSSRFYKNNTAIKKRIYDSLYSLKDLIFDDWDEIKSNKGQYFYIERIAYSTFLIEFLTFEKQNIATALEDILLHSTSIEVIESDVDFLKDYQLFDNFKSNKNIAEIQSNELIMKYKGMIKGFTSRSLEIIDGGLKNDASLRDFFQNVDQDLEPIADFLNYNFFRSSFLPLYLLLNKKENVSGDVSDVAYIELEFLNSMLTLILSPTIKGDTFVGFDIKSYQLELVKDLAFTHRRRASIEDILDLNF